MPRRPRTLAIFCAKPSRNCTRLPTIFTRNFAARSAGQPRPESLSLAQLQSLQANVQVQLAQALRNQALCYPAGSPDQLNSLTQAVEVLADVLRQPPRTRLGVTAQLEEIRCLRLLGEHSAAERKLHDLEQNSPPPQTAQLLRAERIELALARGHIDEALSEAGARQQRDTGPEAEFARLEAQLAAWKRARLRNDEAAAADWQHRYVAQARAIGQAYGPRWMRRSESRLARAIATTDGSQSAEALAYAAASYYRGGQFDKSLSTYDQAVRRARGTEPQRAFEWALTAATIEKQRGRYRDALERYRSLALGAPENSQAAEAHLLAVHCAAQLAQAAHPPDLGEYERLLREHVDSWPAAPTASQAYGWLGRLAEHRGHWPDAVAALNHVKLDDPSSAAAVEAAGRCYDAWLDDLREHGDDGKQIANEALAYLEQILRPNTSRAAKPTAATRAATLAAARIWLKEFPTGAMPAEQLLSAAINNDPAAPPDWVAAARTLLISALAAQGKGAQADQLLDQVPHATATEAVALLQALASIRRCASGDAVSKLARVELSIQNELLANRSALDGASLRAVLREHALLLAETGHRKEGLEELHSLAREFPRDGQTLEDLATLLMQGNSADQRLAIDSWTDVARRSRPGTSRWFRAFYGLARTQLQLGQLREARQTVSHVADKHADFGGGVTQHKFERLAADLERGK